MNSFEKILLTIIMLYYVLCPIDACPGPIDDILVIVIIEVLKKGGGPKSGQESA